LPIHPRAKALGFLGTPSDKWVSHVERIGVIDYDYKGLWESLGYPDEGKMSICPEMLVSDAIFNLNIEAYKINVSGFTAGKIDKMNFNYKDGVLKIDLGFSSNFETFLNLFIEEGKGYSGIDLLLDGRKGNLTLLGNENVKAILLEGIEGEHTITILAYESEIRENGKVSNTIIYLIVLVAIAMVIIYLIFVFEYRIKKNFKI